MYIRDKPVATTTSIYYTEHDAMHDVMNTYMTSKIMIVS